MLRAAAISGARALAPAARSAVSSGMANKRDRQATIRELIEGRAVESQEELRKLRIARVPMPDGGARYAAAAGSSEDGSPPLEALLPHFFTQIDGVGELIVLHTLP